jgi:hypothetical protein
MLELGHFGNQEYLRSVKVWCLRWMEKISQTGSLKNEVLQRVKGGKNILNVKVNFTLAQITKAVRGSKSRALLFP